MPAGAGAHAADRRLASSETSPSQLEVVATHHLANRWGSEHVASRPVRAAVVFVDRRYGERNARAAPPL